MFFVTIVTGLLSKLSIGVDYHRLLWQELNKMYGNGSSTVFVMAVGQQLCSSDYDVTGNAKMAAFNTFELVNNTISCSTNFCAAGSTVSFMWEHLQLGTGPSAGPQQQADFYKAKEALYVDYVKSKRTKLYDEYLEKKQAREEKKIQVKTYCKNNHGDRWEEYYREGFNASTENIEFQDLAAEVIPHLNAIEVWRHGPLVHITTHIRQGTYTLYNTVVMHR